MVSCVYSVIFLKILLATTSLLALRMLRIDYMILLIYMIEFSD